MAAAHTEAFHTETCSRTETLRKDIQAKAAARWNAAGFRYSVVHGAEQYPAQMGRDIDVMTDAASEEAVIATTLSIFRENGWAATAHRMTIGVTRVIAHRAEGGVLHAAEIDVASTGLQWGPVVFLDAPSMEAECVRKGPFVVDLWGSFVKRILLQALSGNIQRLEERPAELTLTDREALIAQDRLAEFTTPALAADFMNAVRAKDLNQLRVCARTLRSSLLRNSLRGPRLAATLHGTLVWVKNRLALNVFTRKAVPVVAFVGPEYVDKSAILEAMRQAMRDELVFPEMLVRHWPSRPRPAPGAANSASAANGAPVSPTQDAALQSKRLSWIDGAHLLRCMLSYLYTHVLEDRRSSAGLQLVVYDQWLLDTLMHVMPHRLSSGAMRAFLKLLPRPDLVILLHDAPPGTATQRAKLPEGTDPSLWHDLAKQGYVDVVLTANAPPTKVARRALRAIVDAFIKMHEGGCPDDQ